MARILPFTVLLLLLAACAEHDLHPPRTFGEAVRNNIAQQVVNPEPSSTALAPAPGVRRGIMVGRYQTDQVEPPIEESTSSVD
jgi:type IV pilus biogenesis protein CpaD/CtpE